MPLQRQRQRQSPVVSPALPPCSPPLSSAPTAYSTFGSCIKLSARLNRCNCKSSFLLRTHGKGEAPGREEGRRICSHGHLTVGALLCSVCVCVYQAQLEHSSALDAAGALSGTFLLRTSFHSIPFRFVPFHSSRANPSYLSVPRQTALSVCACVSTSFSTSSSSSSYDCPIAGETHIFMLASR